MSYGGFPVKIAKECNAEQQKLTFEMFEWIWKKLPRSEAIAICRSAHIPVPDSSKSVARKVGKTIITHMSRKALAVVYAVFSMALTQVEAGVLEPAAERLGMSETVLLQRILQGLAALCGVWLVVITIIVLIGATKALWRAAKVAWGFVRPRLWNGANLLGFNTLNVGMKEKLDQPSEWIYQHTEHWYVDGKGNRKCLRGPQTGQVDTLVPRVGHESAQAGSVLKAATGSISYQCSVFVNGIFMGQAFRYLNYLVTAAHVLSECVDGSTLSFRRGDREVSFRYVDVDDKFAVRRLRATPFNDVMIMRMDDKFFITDMAMTSVKPAGLNGKMTVHISGQSSGEGNTRLTSSGVSFVEKGTFKHTCSTTTGFSGAPLVLRSPYESNPLVVMIHQMGSGPQSPNEGFDFAVVAMWITKFAHLKKGARPESSEEYFKKWMREHYDEIDDRMENRRYHYDEDEEIYYFYEKNRKGMVAITRAEMDLVGGTYDEWERKFDKLYDDVVDESDEQRRPREAVEEEDMKEMMSHPRYKHHPAFDADLRKESANRGGSDILGELTLVVAKSAKSIDALISALTVPESPTPPAAVQEKAGKPAVAAAEQSSSVLLKPTKQETPPPPPETKAEKKLRKQNAHLQAQLAKVKESAKGETADVPSKLSDKEIAAMQSELKQLRASRVGEESKEMAEMRAEFQKRNESADKPVFQQGTRKSAESQSSASGSK